MLGLVVDDFFGGDPFGAEGADLRFVLGVEVRVVGGDGDVHLAAGLEIRGGEFLRGVVALGAPGDVVGVAKGVHIEDVDVGGGEEEVLEEGGEHVPGVEEEDRGDEVEEPGGGHGDDEGKEDFVGEEEGNGEVGVQRELGLDGFDGDEDGGEEEVAVVLLEGGEDWGWGHYSPHEDGPEVDLRHVELIAPLRPIAQCKHETSDEGGEVEPLKDHAHDPARKSQQVGIAQARGQDAEDQEEIAHSEPGKDHLQALIDKLNHECKLPTRAVMAAPDVAKVGESVDGGEESAIEPAASLEDEIGHLGRDVCLASRRFDILQNPGAVPLAD